MTDWITLVNGYSGSQSHTTRRGRASCRLRYAPVANVCDLSLYLDENRVIPEFRHFWKLTSPDEELFTVLYFPSDAFPMTWPRKLFTGLNSTGIKVTKNLGLDPVINEICRARQASEGHPIFMFGYAPPCWVWNGSSLILFLCVQISVCFFPLSCHPIDLKPWHNDPYALLFHAMTSLSVGRVWLHHIRILVSPKKL